MYRVFGISALHLSIAAGVFVLHDYVILEAPKGNPPLLAVAALDASPEFYVDRGAVATSEAIVRQIADYTYSVDKRSQFLTTNVSSNGLKYWLMTDMIYKAEVNTHCNDQGKYGCLLLKNYNVYNNFIEKSIFSQPVF